LESTALSSVEFPELLEMLSGVSACREERQKWWEQEKREAAEYLKRSERVHTRMHQAQVVRMIKAMATQWPAQTHVTRQDVVAFTLFGAGMAGISSYWLAQPAPQVVKVAEGAATTAAPASASAEVPAPEVAAAAAAGVLQLQGLGVPMAHASVTQDGPAAASANAATESSRHDTASTTSSVSIASAASAVSTAAVVLTAPAPATAAASNAAGAAAAAPPRSPVQIVRYPAGAVERLLALEGAIRGNFSQLPQHESVEVDNFMAFAC
jgi:hypothetical protein